MDKAKRSEGDALANELIAQYWRDFEAGDTWNYFTYPGRYVAADTWASDDQWRAIAQRFCERNKYLSAAFSILLRFERERYVSEAQEFVRKWHAETAGHDPEYLYDVLKYFPEENPLRHKYLGDSPNVLDAYRDSNRGCWEERQALISVQDDNLCNFMAERISESLRRSDLSNDEFEEDVLNRMVELGPMCAELVTADLVEIAKVKVYEFLDKDRRVVENNADTKEFSEDERSLWLRDDIGHFASRLNWDDMQLTLRCMKWYWTSQFAESWSDRDNEGLLAWSLRESDELLKRRALWVMKHHQYQPIDGAIAWKRMHPGT